MSETRIPQTIAAFNTYIHNTDDRLKANDPANPPKKYWETYGLVLLNQTDWTAKRTAWDLLFVKYSDPQLKTKIVNEQVENFMNTFRDFGNPILDKIAAATAAAETEEAIFNIDLHRDVATIPTTPITENCIVSALSKGGGLFEFSAKSTTDASRASKPDSADGFHMIYIISDVKPTSIPASSSAGMQKEFFSKAKTSFDFGDVNSGKWLVAYFRWVDSKRPSLAGPLSSVQVVAIG